MIAELIVEDVYVVTSAPSLSAGPISVEARAAVQAAAALGDTPWATQARACTVSYMFDGMERAFATDHDPVALIRALLTNVTTFLRCAAETGYAGLGVNSQENGGAPQADVAEVTGEHYGRLFSAFSDASFWDEPTRLLRVRLERNDIDRAVANGREVLDAGCGGGRYSVAWRRLGAARVTGVDISETGIADAGRRIAAAGIEGVVMRQGSVLELPFSDSAFDIVFSNGVLHHTTDWRRGVFELVRVLRSGGLGWLYLIENPGGLFWDVIEILRVITRGESRTAARHTLRALGIPANRVFYMLDHVMVPINIRLTPAEIESVLKEAGAVGVRRLARGADFDRIERIHRADPFATVKYGVGENRYVFSKP